MPHAPLPSRRAVTAGLATTLIGLPGQVQGQGAALAPGEPAWRTLVAAPMRLKLLPDPAGETEAWAFDGQVPGPVIRVRLGEEARIRLENRTPKPLSLHWHGVRNLSTMDGVGGFSQEPVRPGQSFDYRFTPPDAGTFLARPMVVGDSGEAAERGLGAVLVVEEREPPGVDHEYVLVIDDWKMIESGAFAPFAEPVEAAMGGRLGNWLTCNAKKVPETITSPSGSRLRLRLINAANARSMRVRFDNLKVYVIAVDGQPTDTFEPLRSTLPFSPGSRYDLIIDLTEPGTSGTVMGLLGQNLPLVTVTAEGEPKNTALPPPAALPANKLLAPGIKLQAALRRDVAIAGGARRGPDGKPSHEGARDRIWTVNGRGGAVAAPPLFSIKRGNPVVLKVVNQTGIIQPIHLHGHVFRLLHPFDDGWEPYWLDTLQVPENKTVLIAFVADNPGRWLLSSTVLERFDTGLWAWFEVT